MRLFTLFALLLLACNAHAAESKAIFAGGCFWCMEAEFEELEGVGAVVSGYTGGTVENPTYAQVSTGSTGHVEAVEITYDPEKTPYETLLGIFWDNIDPTDAEGQFCDKGSQYLAGIFVTDDAQKALAEASKAKAEKRYGQVATFIRPAAAFWPAEEHHQGYHAKNQLRYALYKRGCGRDNRLEELKQP